VQKNCRLSALGDIGSTGGRGRSWIDDGGVGLGGKENVRGGQPKVTINWQTGNFNYATQTFEKG